MREIFDRLFKDYSPFLFAQEPIVNFEAGIKNCPVCGAPLKVLKSRSKKVYTLHIGGFIAPETIIECPNCNNKQKYHSSELLQLVPPRSNFGYDVMIYIGKGLFLRNRQELEIKTELAEKNIPISESEISYLAKKFIVY